jgi:quercetin dioxygenase-like cupin family protein
MSDTPRMDALAARSNRRKTILKVSQSSLQNGSPAWRLVFTRVRMQTLRITAVVALIAAGTIASFGTMAQAPGIKRADLLRNDLSVAGREVVEVLVEIAPGVVAPKHSHPGEEIAYVVEGSLEYALEGRPPVTLKAGDALFIPAGLPHVVTNVGSGDASELATYIVEKGKPLLTLVKE